MTRYEKRYERFSDNHKYEEYMDKFEELWNDSKAIDICIKDGNTDFIDEIKKKLWIFAKPTPYQIFIRILFELYSALDNSTIKTPSDITYGKFSNLKYQLDAIKYGVDCINKNNGVIVGNPPYGIIYDNITKAIYEKEHPCFKRNNDIYNISVLRRKFQTRNGAKFSTI